MSTATEVDPKDQVNLRPAHNHIEALYNDGGEPANTSAATALLRLREECSGSPAFPPATVSTQPPDDRTAVFLSEFEWSDEELDEELRGWRRIAARVRQMLTLRRAG